MKFVIGIRKLLIMLILILEMPNLYSQDLKDLDKEQVTEVFELFFNSMTKRDTLTLKSIIHTPHSSRWFIKFFSGNDQQLRGSSASTIGGFLKIVSAEDGNIERCTNDFEKIDIQLNQRYAIVTANYQCFVQGQINSRGLYVIQLLKSDKWKIESLSRYIENAE